MNLARNLTDRSTLAFGWIRRNQRIDVSYYDPVKINLGCGLTVAPNWINFDGSLNALLATLPEWLQLPAYRLTGARQYFSESEYRTILSNNIFVFHNMAYGLPLDDDSVDFIYSSHFLEHLDRHAGQHLLKECLRTLKPGGLLRVGIPDLEYAWELYQKGHKERMLHDYFFIDGATGFSQHRYLYDFEMLSQLLTNIGYVDIRRMAYQQGDMPDIQILDNRAEYTLFVEARCATQ